VTLSCQPVTFGEFGSKTPAGLWEMYEPALSVVPVPPSPPAPPEGPGCTLPKGCLAGVARCDSMPRYPRLDLSALHLTPRFVGVIARSVGTSIRRRAQDRNRRYGLHIVYFHDVCSHYHGPCCSCVVSSLAWTGMHTSLGARCRCQRRPEVDAPPLPGVCWAHIWQQPVTDLEPNAAIS
jgi:hypothetical protein